LLSLTSRGSQCVCFLYHLWLHVFKSAEFFPPILAEFLFENLPRTRSETWQHR
jgi:hypothetical protein